MSEDRSVATRMVPRESAHTARDNSTLVPLQLFLLLPGLAGVGMIGRWWGSPLPGVSALSIGIGTFLILITLWGILWAR